MSTAASEAAAAAMASSSAALAAATSGAETPEQQVELLTQQNMRLRQALAKFRDMTTAEITELKRA